METIMQTRLSRRTVQKLALALPAPLLLAAPRRVLAQEATPSAPPSEVLQYAEDTYAFLDSGYISLFIVTDEGVIATDPASQNGPERAEAFKAAIVSVTDQPVRYLIYSHHHPDHAIGGDVFADTATFIAHRNAVEKIAGLNEPRAPAPEIGFDSEMTIELGGKTIELYYTGRNHSDNSIVLLYPERQLLFAVDFIPIDRLPFQDLSDSYPEEWIESLRWVEDNLDFDTLVPGHPPTPGTKEDVSAMRQYLEDLLASIRAARDQGLTDNSPEMVAAVTLDLEPAYGAWGMFEEWLPLNIEGVIRGWTVPAAEEDATPAPLARSESPSLWSTMSRMRHGDGAFRTKNAVHHPGQPLADEGRIGVAAARFGDVGAPVRRSTHWGGVAPAATSDTHRTAPGIADAENIFGVVTTAEIAESHRAAID